MHYFAEARYAKDRANLRAESSTMNACSGYTRSLALCRDVPLSTLRRTTLESADTGADAETMKSSRSAPSITGQGRTRGTYSVANGGITTDSTEMSCSRSIKRDSTNTKVYALGSEREGRSRTAECAAPLFSSYAFGPCSRVRTEHGSQFRLATCSARRLQ